MHRIVELVALSAKAKQVLHILIGFGMVATLSLSAYAFYFVDLRSDSRVFYQVSPYLYPLAFLAFPTISTIVFYLLQKGKGASRAGILNMAYFAFMYAVLAIFIVYTRYEYRLSYDILEQEARVAHIVLFLVGLAISFIVGKLVGRMFRRATLMQSKASG